MRRPKPGYQTRALTRALEIMDLFSVTSGVQSVRDIHVRLGIPKPTITRLTSELVQAGYLARVPDGYVLGPKAFELGIVYLRQNTFVELCRGPLDKLAAATAQTSSLSEVVGSAVVHLVVAPSPRPVQHVKRAGSRVLPHCSAAGKALLAQLPLDAVDRLLGPEPYRRLTDRSLGSREEVLAELERVRHRGFALDDEETARGLKCVAVFVDLGAAGPAGLSVSGPAADYTRAAIPRYFEALQVASAELRVALDVAHAATAAPVEESLPEIISVA